MSNSTFTLEKERTAEIPSLDLIADGPNEVAMQLITKFHQANKEAKLEQRKASLALKEIIFKQNFVRAFIDEYTAAFNIKKEQFRELVSGIKEDNILIIESAVAGRMRKRALAVISGCIISGGATIYEAMNVFINHHTPGFGIIVLCVGWVLPYLTLGSFIVSYIGSGNESPFKSISYLGRKKRLRKKYGRNYFPYEELRTELQLSGEELKRLPIEAVK